MTRFVTAGQRKINPKAYPIRPGTKVPYIGHAYDAFKYSAKAFGYYQDIKPYLPETYLDKYTYKPHKRISGYAGQIWWAKKKRFGFRNKFQQKYKKSVYGSCYRCRYYNYDCYRCRQRRKYYNNSSYSRL